MYSMYILVIYSTSHKCEKNIYILLQFKNYFQFLYILHFNLFLRGKVEFFSITLVFNVIYWQKWEMHASNAYLLDDHTYMCIPAS